MEPFEIRTTPPRISPLNIVVPAVLLVFAVSVFCLMLRAIVFVGRNTPDDRTRYLNSAFLVLLACGWVWLYLRLSAPSMQMVLAHFRDRGRRVVAFSLDDSGWRYLGAGTDVVLPWDGMTVAVTERTDHCYHVRVSSDGPLGARWDPLSRHVARALRKDRGFYIPLTLTDPTEDELASAIAQQSAGRVALAR